MSSLLKQYLLVIAAALSLILMPSAANAQYFQLSCDNSNGSVASGQLYYADQPNQQGACQNQNGALINHIFSQIVCDFVTVLNGVMGQIYCGIQYELTPVLAILLSLYLAVFGMQILMGTAQLNAKEIIVRLLKIAGVWMFATQSIWGLSLIFQFFFGVAAQGSMWVLQSVNPTLTMPGQIPNSADFGNFMSIYQFLDTLIYGFINWILNQASNKIVGFGIVLMGFFPSLFTMAMTWLINTLVMLGRALIDFMLSLSAIAFLIALSPIFLSFMLFQSTAHIFEDWLKFLISYSLQIVIIFAIIALWIAAISMFGGFFTELSSMIFPKENVVVGSMFSPNDTYNICEYAVGMGPPGGICPIAGNLNAPCPPGIDSCAAYPDSPCLPYLACDGSGRFFSPSQLEFHADFIYFMAYNLTVLTIIAYAFSVLIKEAPDIAKNLSGPATVKSLGGGFGMKGLGQLGSIGKAMGGGAKAKAPPGSPGTPTGNITDRIKAMLTGR